MEQRSSPDVILNFYDIRIMLVVPELMREYRRVDDTVTMRLNRTMAQFRDRNSHALNSKASSEQEACNYFWQDLVGM